MKVLACLPLYCLAAACVATTQLPGDVGAEAPAAEAPAVADQPEEPVSAALPAEEISVAAAPRIYREAEPLTPRHEFADPPPLVFDIEILEDGEWRTIVSETVQRIPPYTEELTRYTAKVDLAACRALAPDLGIGLTHRHLHVVDGAAPVSMRVTARTDYPVIGLLSQLKVGGGVAGTGGFREYRTGGYFNVSEDRRRAEMIDNPSHEQRTDPARTVEFDFALPADGAAPAWAAVESVAHFATPLGTVMGRTRVALLAAADCTRCTREADCPEFGMEAIYWPDDEGFWQDENPEQHARWKTWRDAQGQGDTEN